MKKKKPMIAQERGSEWHINLNVDEHCWQLIIPESDSESLWTLVLMVPDKSLLVRVVPDLVVFFGPVVPGVCAALGSDFFTGVDFGFGASLLGRGFFRGRPRPFFFGLVSDTGVTVAALFGGGGDAFCGVTVVAGVLTSESELLSA